MKPNKIVLMSGFESVLEPTNLPTVTSVVYRNADNDSYDYWGNLIEDPWDVVDTFIKSDFMRGYAPFMSATMRFDSWQFTVTKEMVK